MNLKVDDILITINLFIYRINIYKKNILFNIMSLVPIKSIENYTKIKETLRNRFESERTGDQDLFVQQTKALQPLINATTTPTSTQKESLTTLKALQENQNITNQELQRRNELAQQQMQALAQQAAAEPSFLTPQASAAGEPTTIDLDGQLNQSDRENLEDLGLELPSLVFKNKNTEEALEKIKTENRSIGQKVGEKSKLSKQEQDIHISRRETLKTYKKIIEGLEGAKQFISTPKNGKGFLKGKGFIDAIYYSIEDLCSKLSELVAAKSAGHTGLNNNINTILDELLKINAIDKEQYNSLYKSNFS